MSTGAAPRAALDPAGIPAPAEPIHFGRPDSPLFGWYHPGSPAPRYGVVICPPVGYEQIRAYRGLRHLAERVARGGAPALRFDYHGTGDSAGDDLDSGRVRAWLDSVEAAVDELQRLSGVREVALFGLRLGATLATTAAAAKGGLGSLVLWSPCVSGRVWLREMRAFRMMMRRPGMEASQPAPESDDEAAGFPLTAETTADLKRLDLLALAEPPARRVLLIGRDELAGDEPLAEHLRGLGAEVECRRIMGYSAMMLAEAHNAQVPGELFEQAASWLEAAPMAPREAAAAPAPRAPRAAVTIAAGGDRVREQALSFGDRGRLFGILTEPLAPSAGRPTVVLLNNGAVTRVGSNRLYVTLARRWAALGFPVLRMDLGGIGDSRPAPGLAENVLYDPSGVADVLSALAHLQKTRAHERFVLAGLCAGGYFAFHTALLGPPVAGVIMINPLTFYWKPGDTIDEAPSEVYSTLREYKRSLFRQERWGKLLRGQVPVAYVLQLLLNWTATLVKTRLGQLRRRLARVGPGRGDVAADFRSLVDRGVDLLIVFSAGDASIDLVELHAGRELKRLARKGGLQTAVLEGADHTFTPVAAQRRLSDRLTEHLEQRFGRQARVEGSESASSRMR